MEDKAHRLAAETNARILALGAKKVVLQGEKPAPFPPSPYRYFNRWLECREGGGDLFSHIPLTPLSIAVLSRQLLDVLCPLPPSPNTFALR